MRPVYGRSPWVDRFPKSRVPSRPTARGEIDTDVVVIGGGLTGCLTAYALAVAGLRVVVVEADRVGRGASSAASGWITDTAGQSFIEMEARLGRRAARHAWQAWRRAALDLEALIRRLAIRCYLVGAPALLVAHSVEQASQLARERTERGDAGIEGSLLTARTVGPVTVAAKARPATLVQRTGQLMYELSTFYPEMSGLQPSHGWDVPYVTTATGLPLIGPHRNYPRHLFAFGSPSRSLTASCLASRLLVRQHLGETQAGDDIFGFSR